MRFLTPPSAVGDFGLATSSLAAVLLNDKPSHIGILEDMTLGLYLCTESLGPSDQRFTSDVGTVLYMAPEVVSGTPFVPPQERFKADMYSLGIVFFEMNYFFDTGPKRISVLEDLRCPGIFFPDDWDPMRTRQQQGRSFGRRFRCRPNHPFVVITSLLQHDPVQRPSALELSQSPLLPPLLQDESFKRSLDMIGMNRGRLSLHLAGPSNLGR
jgi:eukaryotic translation initiation factor 2-alpha kinase 4